MQFKRAAIIGYSGLIGKNILEQIKNKIKKIYLFNSKNIQELNSKSIYDIVFCAGLPAAKWIANKYPSKDKKNTLKLIKYLKKVKTKSFVLISTIDVNFKHAYGKNRLYLEKFVRKNFINYLIIRLPGVFGHGLKKNVIFDLLNSNDINKIFINDHFQWYDLSLLIKDIFKIYKNNTNGIYELYSEPISNNEILKKFKNNKINQKRKKPIIYNFKPQSGYYYSKGFILLRLQKFIKSYEN